MPRQILNTSIRLVGENCGGIASRTNYDLKQHMEHSSKDLQYFDEAAKEKYVSHLLLNPL